MKRFSVCYVFLALALASATLRAQSWDPLRTACGWARVDKDGSIAFYDPGRRKVVSWMLDGGVLGEVNVSGLPQALWYWQIAQGVGGEEDVSGRPQQPEKWVLDASLNAWVVTGRYLQFISKDGKVANTKLPCEVGDLDWDTQGIYLSYRCSEPFIEKRGYANGEVIWSFGTGKDKPSPMARHRIAVTEDKTLLLSHPDGFHLDLIDGSSGKPKGQIAFTRQGKPAPSRMPGSSAPGPLAWWLNRNIALQSLPADQVPSLGLTGLLLARENLSTATVEFIPTGLSDKHTFIGVIESNAVFVAPGGGLAFVAIYPH